MARAMAGHRSALIRLLLLSGIWAGLLKGGSFVFTSITNLPADAIHFGSLLSGLAAAYATWRLL